MCKSKEQAPKVQDGKVGEQFQVGGSEKHTSLVEKSRKYGVENTIMLSNLT